MGRHSMLAPESRSTNSFRPRNDRRDAGPVHPGKRPQANRRRRDQSPGIAGRNQRVGLAFADQSTARTIEQSFFLRKPSTGLSSMVRNSEAWTTRTRDRRKPRLGQDSPDRLVWPTRKELGDLVRWTRAPLGALDHDPGAMVAAHDIHRDAHKLKERGGLMSIRAPKCLADRLR